MKIIEQLFHISPDQGTGLMEVAFFVVLVAVPLLCAALRNKSKRSASLILRLPQACSRFTFE
jgi:hypothetical protein